MHEPEEVLAGGNVSPVVRIGDTVRRTCGPWTPAVHALLQHLASVGFDRAPRVLGIDDHGREVLTYMPGRSGIAPFPPEMFDGSTIDAMARLLRDYHDAVADFSPPFDALWRTMPGAPPDGEVICHNDIAPYNTIFRDGRPDGLIDWDFAGPGTRLWDIAYAVWRFVPLYNNDECRALGWPVLDRGRRLRRFCDAYGLDDRSQLLDTIDRRQRSLYDTLRLWGQAGVEGFAVMWMTGHGSGPLRDLDYLRRQRSTWQSFLE